METSHAADAAPVIVAATPIEGHVVPMLTIAADLVHRGHEVTVLTGSRFWAPATRTGAKFCRLGGRADFDDRRLDDAFPDRSKREPGVDQLSYDLCHLFGDVIPDQHDALQGLLRSAPDSVVVYDTAFFGAWPSLLGADGVRPAAIGIGLLPLTLPSIDTAPFGTGLPPDPTPEGRARNRRLQAEVDGLFAGAQAHLEGIVGALGGRGLPPVFRAIVEVPDLFLQLTVAGFEYPRSDAPASLRLVGPLPVPPHEFSPPWWWESLDGQSPVVVVTQGTLINTDLGQLIGPTLEALADLAVTVVVTAGRPRALRDLPKPVPPNAIITSFIPYAQLLPRTTVLVTSGGYGGVQQALSHGVPLVVAGGTEDKPEIAARVAWSGAGIDLRTGRPDADAVRAAVLEVLSEGSYRDAAARLRREFRSADALSAVSAAIASARTAPAGGDTVAG